HRINTHGIYGAPIVDEAFKFHNLRDQIEVYRLPIPSYNRFHFQSHASVSRLPCRRGGRGHHHWNGCSSSDNGGSGSAADRRNLRLSVCSRKPKFSNNFDDGALST